MSDSREASSMSFVTVQLGQCGNQIGANFFSALLSDSTTSSTNTGVNQACNNEYYTTVCDRFFRQASTEGFYHPRALLVDMEQKVISQTMNFARSSGKWLYSNKQHFSQKSGSGNNWAYGYKVHGARCEHEIDALVRREVEMCDRFDGFLCLMSLAGGTGSGLGTYVTRMLRDEYPKSFIMNQVVTPFRSGEVIVQSYNALLTLATLYEASDGLVVLQNDHIQDICSQLLGLKQVSFKHINRVISHQMASIFAPAISCDVYNKHENYLGNYIEDIFCHPSYKLSSILSVPVMAENSIQFSTFNWSSLLRTLRQMLIARAHMEEGINWGMKIRPESDFNKSVGNILVLRGKDFSEKDAMSFRDAGMYQSWLPEGERLHIYHNKRAIGAYEKSACLLTNSQCSVAIVDSLVDKAWSMFTNRAYVHQYTRHGLEEEDFLNCFTMMEQVLHNYSSL